MIVKEEGVIYNLIPIMEREDMRLFFLLSFLLFSINLHAEVFSVPFGKSLQLAKMAPCLVYPSR